MANRWIIVTVALILVMGLGGCPKGEKVPDNDAKSIQEESGDDRGKREWPHPIESGEKEWPPVDEDWQPPKEWGKWPSADEAWQPSKEWEEKWPEGNEKWQLPKEWGEEKSPKDSTK